MLLESIDCEIFRPALFGFEKVANHYLPFRACARVPVGSLKAIPSQLVA